MILFILGIIVGLLIAIINILIRKPAARKNILASIFNKNSALILDPNDPLDSIEL